MNFRHAKICLLHVVRDSQDFISRTLFIATIFTIQGSSCILETLTTAILLKYSMVIIINQQQCSCYFFIFKPVLVLNAMVFLSFMIGN